jgi:hypothetical protein
LNRGARDWHADLFRECAARNREVTVATSMELVLPPPELAAEFADGAKVTTDMGFAGLNSTHCSFVSGMTEFKKEVYEHLADLMAHAGCVPGLQFGEFLWWFFTNYHPVDNPNGGMGFYDAETRADAETVLGRPLHIFRGPDDDPGVNSFQDALFLRNRLRDHLHALADHVRSKYPLARLELLYPYDVNHPTPTALHRLGGALNYFVNLPEEWKQKGNSPLDRIKMEALDFGAYERNLDMAEKAIRFPLVQGWPADSVRYLAPVFRGGYPWEKEVALAYGNGVPVVNLWAFDHLCIYNLDVVGRARGRAFQRKR